MTYAYPLPRPDRRAGSRRAQIEAAVLDEMERLGDRMTTVRFLFYRLVSEGVLPKAYPGKKRTPSQDVSDVVTELRDAAVIPMWQIADDTRSVRDWPSWESIREAVDSTLDKARLDPWVDDHPQPQLWVESRSIARVLLPYAYMYRVPVVPLGGQSSRSFDWEVANTVTEETPIIYLGDFDKAGFDIINSFLERVAALQPLAEDRTTRHARLDEDVPAGTVDELLMSFIQLDQRRDYVYSPIRLKFGRLALTREQIEEEGIETITKQDGRDGKSYESAETEALGQDRIEELVETRLQELLPVSLEELEARADAERTELRGTLTEEE